jgi:hypothetical protein
MKKTVFVSSTYEDLKEHRKIVWEVLRKYEVDIRGMEQFGARTESELETCMAECEQSDVYIGILSMRCGSIEEQSGKSYTQLEYEQAYSKSKEILFFLVDEKDSEISPQFVDFGQNH